MSTPARPFLKWAGGKGRLLAQYQPYLPQKFSHYYEPFLGGGALFFHLQPQHAVLSDINPELVNVYTCVRDRPEDVIQQLQCHATHHSKEYYYQIRAQLPESAVAKAARLIYLNKTCFNGLYRVNARGRFNVPMGRYKNPKICDSELLKTASVVLQNTTIIERSFDKVVEDANTAEDFVYFDPPYHPLSETSNFTSYSRFSFTSEHQIRLRDTFVQLANRGVQVVQSNADCAFIRELYQDFHIDTIEATRAINSDPTKRGKITEVLITSW